MTSKNWFLKIKPLILLILIGLIFSGVTWVMKHILSLIMFLHSYKSNYRLEQARSLKLTIEICFIRSIRYDSLNNYDIRFIASGAVRRFWPRVSQTGYQR
jgi:hypothetical protein